MADFLYSFDNPLGDLAPELWPDTVQWQNTRTQLLDYFEQTKEQQFKTPLGKAEFYDYLTGYHEPRKQNRDNCFSYACEMIADGLTIEPVFLAYAGLDRLMEETPFELLVTKNKPYDIQYAQSLECVENLHATLSSIGFSKNLTDENNTMTPVIALLQKKNDYHFLKVLTGMNGDLPRIAFLEHGGPGKNVSYHENPQHYFQSPEYFGRTMCGYGEASVLYPPNTLKNLKLSGESRQLCRDDKPVAYYYKAKASYTP